MSACSDTALWLRAPKGAKAWGLSHSTLSAVVTSENLVVAAVVPDQKAG